MSERSVSDAAAFVSISSIFVHFNHFTNLSTTNGGNKEIVSLFVREVLKSTRALFTAILKGIVLSFSDLKQSSSLSSFAERCLLLRSFAR